MTLIDFIEHRISTINLPYPREQYDIIQPVATACFGRDIYLRDKVTGDKIWIARFTATELKNDEVDWARHYRGDI